MDVRRLICCGLGLTLASGAIAAPYSPFDVRAAGMGGTGVASAKAASAALFNPALLSAQGDDDKFQFVLGLGAQATDEDEMFDQTDELSTQFDELTTAITNYRNTPNATTQSALVAETLGTRQSLADIDGDRLLIGAGAALGVGVPNAKMGVGLSVSGNAFADATPHVASVDLQTLQNLADDLNDNNFLDDPNNQALVLSGTYTPASTAEATGVLLSEIGLGLSHRFELPGGGMLAVGVTPKAVDVTTYHYEERLDSFDEEDIDDATLKAVGNHVDVDVGLMYRAGAESHWQYGLSVRNLANKTYDTVATPYSPPRQIEINTQYRAGIAHITKRSTVALDVDLAENAGISTGSEGDATRFVALGAEYDLKYLQFRAGYRANIADSEVADVASIGLGLGPVDISAAASDGSLGAYLQFGFGW